MAKRQSGPDIFGELVADHARHRALLAALDATSGASPARKALFEELDVEIRGHAAAEEQALWSSVLRKPQITQDGRHAVAEHHEMDELLDELAATDMATGGWLIRFRLMKAVYLHHIEEEEKVLFLDVAKHLDTDDQTHMASVFNRRKQAEKAKVKAKAEQRKS